MKWPFVSRKKYEQQQQETRISESARMGLLGMLRDAEKSAEGLAERLRTSTIETSKAIHEAQQTKNRLHSLSRWIAERQPEHAFPHFPNVPFRLAMWSATERPFAGGCVKHLRFSLPAMTWEQVFDAGELAQVSTPEALVAALAAHWGQEIAAKVQQQIEDQLLKAITA